MRKADTIQIEDDAQVNQVSEDEGSDIKSPDMEDIASPATEASQDSQAKVQPKLLGCGGRAHLTATQPAKLDTMLPVRTRADSDDAPQSVIHAPAHFKTFVCVAYLTVALHRR